MKENNYLIFFTLIVFVLLIWVIVPNDSVKFVTNAGNDYVHDYDPGLITTVKVPAGKTLIKKLVIPFGFCVKNIALISLKTVNDTVGSLKFSLGTSPGLVDLKSEELISVALHGFDVQYNQVSCMINSCAKDSNKTIYLNITNEKNDVAHLTFEFTLFSLKSMIDYC